MFSQVVVTKSLNHFSASRQKSLTSRASNSQKCWSEHKLSCRHSSWTQTRFCRIPSL